MSNTNSNGLPPSLGPGARPIGQVQRKDASSIFAEIQEIRSHYSVGKSEDGSALNIGYELRGMARQYSVPFDNMPVGQWTRWLLYGSSFRTMVTGTFVVDMVRGAENLAQRQLSQTEVEGYSMHASRRMLYSWAGVISPVAIGSSMAYVGRSKMKFPFRKPQPSEKYDNFPNRYFPIVRGQFARVAWHITRANLYIFGWLLLAAPFYRSMGDTAMTTGLYRDPRTMEMMKSVAERLKSAQRNRLDMNTMVERPQGQPTIQDQSTPVEYQDSDPASYYDDTQREMETGHAAGRDNDEHGDMAFTDSAIDTGMLSDAQMRQRETKQPTPTAFTGNPAYMRKRVQQPQDLDRSAEPDYFFDDASPTAGNGTDIATPTRSNTGGSVWSRIRSGATPAEPGNKKGVTPSGLQKRQGRNARDQQERKRRDSQETSSDSFSFSSSEQEKQLAKDQAQREFDLLVERERSGRDGDSSTGFGGGGGSAWERRRNG